MTQVLSAPGSRLPSGVSNAPNSAAVAISTAELPGVNAYVEFVEGLDRIQGATGHSFPVPAVWTSRDLHEVRLAMTLLAGDAIKVGRGPARFVMDPHVAERLRTASATAPGHRLEIEASTPYLAKVCGREFAALTGIRPSVEETPLEHVDAAFDRMLSGDARFRMVLTTGR
jgi:hypothetical protein